MGREEANELRSMNLRLSSILDQLQLMTKTRERAVPHSEEIENQREEAAFGRSRTDLTQQSQQPKIIIPHTENESRQEFLRQQRSNQPASLPDSHEAPQLPLRELPAAIKSQIQEPSPLTPPQTKDIPQPHHPTQPRSKDIPQPHQTIPSQAEHQSPSQRETAPRTEETREPHEVGPSLQQRARDRAARIALVARRGAREGFESDIQGSTRQLSREATRAAFIGAGALGAAAIPFISQAARNPRAAGRQAASQARFIFSREGMSTIGQGLGTAARRAGSIVARAPRGFARTVGGIGSAVGAGVGLAGFTRRMAGRGRRVAQATRPAREFLSRHGRTAMASINRLLPRLQTALRVMVTSTLGQVSLGILGVVAGLVVLKKASNLLGVSFTAMERRSVELVNAQSRLIESSFHIASVFRKFEVRERQSQRALGIRTVGSTENLLDALADFRQMSRRESAGGINFFNELQAGLLRIITFLGNLWAIAKKLIGNIALFNPILWQFFGLALFFKMATSILGKVNKWIDYWLPGGEATGTEAWIEMFNEAVRSPMPVPIIPPGPDIPPALTWGFYLFGPGGRRRYPF